MSWITAALRPRHFMPAALTVLFMFALLVETGAQRRTNRYFTTRFDDIVFAISFSPDGRTLAIARGATDPSQRFGRIELWNTENGKLRHVIKGFDGPVSSISFSPDGQTIVSGSSEYYAKKLQEKEHVREGELYGELKWWDANTGELKRKLKLSGKDEFSPYSDSGQHLARAAYSPDGNQLAVAEYSVQNFLLYTGSNFGPYSFRRDQVFGTVLKLLDAQTGEQKLKVTLDTHQPAHLLFSPNGELVAIQAEPAPWRLFKTDYIVLRNARTGREERKLKGFKGEPNSAAFSPDSRLLAVASTRFEDQDVGGTVQNFAKSEVKLFDLRTWKTELELPDLGVVNSVAFVPGGRFLVIGGLVSMKEGSAPGLKLWDLQAGRATNLLTGGEGAADAVGLLAVSQDGGLIAFQSGVETVKLLDTQTWKVTERWNATSVGDAVERPTNRFLLSVKLVLAVAFSADGETLAAETDQGEIKLWDPRTGEVKKKLNGNQEDPSLVAVSANGQSFAEVSGGKVLLWRVGSDAKQLVPLTDGPSVNAVAVSADGETVAIGRGQDVLLLKRGATEKTLNGQHGVIKSLAFKDDGRMLAAVAEDGTIGIWDLANARLGKTISNRGALTALRFAPNGQVLATAAEDHSITLWNLKTGLSQATLQKHDGPINALAFSPDGQLLASGGDDRTVVVWETATGKAKRTLKGHDQTVTSLAFSPDGGLLASGSGNASVVLWDVSTGKFSRVLR